MICDWDDLHEFSNRLDLLERLHDINPGFRATVFAIPGLGSNTFWDSLPDWLEVAGHGWLHPHPREAEHWTKSEALRILDRLPERFVNGWKSPGWQISDGTYEALLERGFWVADHPENNGRRPRGIPTHVLGDGDHWHGHIQNVCGNGIEETWDGLSQRVSEAESFQLISEVVTPWEALVAA